jgi:8-oxo-dGTP pyrophosphatase MutT (NUDIX family)
MASPPFGPALRQAMADRMERFARRTAASQAKYPRGAAVTITVLPGEKGEPCFVLTQRAFHLDHHPGQYALPGGKIEPGESATEAALRELEEEVGVRTAPGDVLGLLDDFVTRSGFLMIPVVVWLAEDQPLVPDPSEVHAVHRVPFAELDHPDLPILTPIPQSDRPVLSLPLVGTHVFAPTAAILYQAHEVLFHGRETRVAHFEQPLFAWR